MHVPVVDKQCPSKTTRQLLLPIQLHPSIHQLHCATRQLLLISSSFRLIECSETPSVHIIECHVSEKVVALSFPFCLWLGVSLCRNNLCFHHLLTLCCLFLGFFPPLSAQHFFDQHSAARCRVLPQLKKKKRVEPIFWDDPPDPGPPLLRPLSKASHGQVILAASATRLRPRGNLSDRRSDATVHFRMIPQDPQTSDSVRFQACLPLLDHPSKFFHRAPLSGDTTVLSAPPPLGPRASRAVSP